MIHPQTALAIATIAHDWGLAPQGRCGPFDTDDSFWRESANRRLKLGLLVRAARNLTCFTRSDNVTWCKKGGLPPRVGALEAVRAALDDWMRFAAAQAGPTTQGSLQVRLVDASENELTGFPRVDAVVTSPPYANRLDYTRLWGPELAVLRTIFPEAPVTALAASQIGTTTVAARRQKAQLFRFPRSVASALAAIESDPAEFSDTYYHPFFLNYAVDLQRALYFAARRLRRGGRFVVFVRDTVRKDVLFPTDDLVQSTLRRDCGLAEVAHELVVIRGHIGLRSQREVSLQGGAQRESWFCFRRS